MNTTGTEASSQAWSLMEQERRRDDTIRRVSTVAWACTFVALLAYAGIVGARVWTMSRMVSAGAIPANLVIEAVVPLVAVIGALSLLIAALSTIGMFYRLRTASLIEIRMRLEALENSLTARP